MNDKLISNNSFIFVIFSLLPVSFILGNAILEFNIFLIIITFLKEILKNKYEYKKILQSKLFLILLFLWVYLNINALLGINYEISLKRSIFFFRYILLVFAFVFFLKHKILRDKVLNLWTLILLIVCFDIFFEFLFGKNILGFESPMKNERIVSFFKDELIVGSFLGTFLFILFGRFYNDDKVILSILLFSIFAFSILLTGERSISLKVFFSIILIIFFVMKKPKLKVIILIIPIFLLLMVFTSEKLNHKYQKTFIHMEKNFQNTSIYEGILETKYLNQFLFSFEIFKQNYFTGVGTKNYLSACSNLDKTSKNEIIKNKVVYCFTHPHQFYYEFISEHGLVGTIIILSIIFLLFSRDKNIEINEEKKQKLFIFKIYIIISLIPIIPSGSFFSSLQLFQFFINYSFYQIYLLEKNLLPDN